MTRRWGVAQRRDVIMRGLGTRYENGKMSREAYIAALIREATYLDNKNASSILYSPLDAGHAKAYRERAATLIAEEESEEDERTGRDVAHVS